MPLLDGCRFLSNTSGTVSFVENSAVAGYQSLAWANAVNGSQYKYHAESPDRTQWEDGIGTYTSSTFTLSRDTVFYNSANTGTLQSGAGTKISFTVAPTVAIVLMKSDLNFVQVADTAPAGAPDNTLWFESDTGLLYIRYNDGTSTQWVTAMSPGPPVMGSYARFTYTATAAQTVFTGNDDNGSPLNNSGSSLTEVDVDGLRLLPSDYTVNSPSQITIANPLDVGQKVYITCFAPFNVANTLSASANGGDIADKIAFRSLLPNPGALFGLTLSTAGASTSFGIAVGYAADSTNVSLMRLAAAFTKTTGAWVIGTAAGALDTGTIAINTWYYVFLIQRPDTGAVDVLVSLSATTPTLPASYTLFRRIGSMRTNASSQWIAFVQNGDDFLWAVPVQDSTGAIGTSASALVVSVPSGIRTNVTLAGLAVGTAGVAVLISSFDSADTTPSNAAFNIYMTGANVPYNLIVGSVNAQIRLRSNGTPTLYVNTFGWIDRRGRDA